jgi:hypothetical protein
MYVRQIDENPYSQIESSDQDAIDSCHNLQTTSACSSVQPDEPDHEQEQQVRQVRPSSMMLMERSKSLSGSVQDVQMLPPINASKLSKGLSLRSLAPARPMLHPHANNMMIHHGAPFVQPYYPAFNSVAPTHVDKATLKLWKKNKSKSMANLIPNAACHQLPPPPPFMFMPPPPFAHPHQQQPMPITGNIHTIKKKSKKNKQLQKLQAQQQQQWLMHHQQQQQQMLMAQQAVNVQSAHDIMYMPPMRSLTPLPSGSQQAASNISGYLTGPRRKAEPEQEQNIYRRKGHLNERAFSYSIRQEQRSRSGSLANLVTSDESPDLMTMMQQLQLDTAPKTASIKRSQFNSISALRPNKPRQVQPPAAPE